MMTRTSPVQWAGRIVHGASQAIAMLAIGAMIIHVVGNAGSRYLFNDPIAGTLEYSAFWYLPAMVFLGIHLAQASGTHIRAGLLFDRFPRRVQVETHVVGELITAAVFVGFGWFGWLEARELAVIKATAGASTVPMWQIAFIVPVACTMVVIQILFGIYDVLRTGNPDVVAERRAAASAASGPEGIEEKQG